MRLSARPLVILALGSLLACSARDKIERRLTGAEGAKLIAAADSLGETGGRESRVVPEERWPEEIRALGPESVRAGPGGVFIQMRSFFVRESGIYVASKDAKVETGPERDPALEHLWDRIYWYRIRG